MSAAAMSLDSLALKYGTDKSSGWHAYAEAYDAHLGFLRNERFTFMELGVGFDRNNKGASLRMWRDYLPNAQIVGVDIRPDAREAADDRIAIEIGDCSDPSFLTDLVQRHDPTVVLDDASHIWSHQKIALRTIVPLLKSGSHYIVEDLHTSFGKYRDMPMFADREPDTGSMILHLSSLILGSNKAHPFATSPVLEPEDEALAARIAQISFVRSVALLQIADREPSPASLKAY